MLELSSCRRRLRDPAVRAWVLRVSVVGAEPKSRRQPSECYVYQPAVVGKFGYVMFKLKSVAPEYPATNVELVSRFLNGLDSDRWYCFQSVLQWSTVLNGYRRWTLFNFINNGYKLALDRSGTWISSQTVNEPEGPSWTVGQQPFLKIKYRPFSEGVVLSEAS
jgi:hypothetical protein